MINQTDSEKINKLNIQKSMIENELKKLEKKQIDVTIINSLYDLKNIKDSLSEMQRALNISWKKIQKIEDNLKNILKY